MNITTHYNVADLGELSPVFDRLDFSDLEPAAAAGRSGIGAVFSSCLAGPADLSGQPWRDAIW
jgi:hypothetical protein